jgi:hypothetical protein
MVFDSTHLLTQTLNVTPGVLWWLLLYFGVIIGLSFWNGET